MTVENASHWAMIIIQLLVAMLCGGLIGYQRETLERPAGFRTHMLVCLGAALAMLTDEYIFRTVGGSTPTRIAAQVVSGIGFLGAGTIIVTRRQQVKGLTTAAGLWASACMGLALGTGFYLGAAVGFIFILLVIVLLQKVDYALERFETAADLYLELDSLSGLKEFGKYCRDNKLKYNFQQIEKLSPGGDGGVAVLVTVDAGRGGDLKSAVAGFNLLPGIGYVEEIS
jgi:putative Mg2+ transporter-C (MgtC) family protein